MDSLRKLRMASKSAALKQKDRCRVYGFNVLVPNHGEVSQITWLPSD